MGNINVIKLKLEIAHKQIIAINSVAVPKIEDANIKLAMENVTLCISCLEQAITELIKE